MKDADFKQAPKSFESNKRIPKGKGKKIYLAVHVLL